LIKTKSSKKSNSGVTGSIHDITQKNKNINRLIIEFFSIKSANINHYFSNILKKKGVK